MQQQSHTVNDQPIARRGVYELPFLGLEGERFLVAVDRRGRRVMDATIYPTIADPGLITDILEEVLDRIDVSPLRIVP